MNAFSSALDSSPSITAPKLARVLGVTPATVYEWKSGRRPIPVQHCHSIEREFEGAVTRKGLRPNDWHLIWPELAQPGAAMAAVASEGGANAL